MYIWEQTKKVVQNWLYSTKFYASMRIYIHEIELENVLH